MFGDAFTNADRKGEIVFTKQASCLLALHSCWVNTAVWPLFDPGVVVVLKIKIVVEFALPIVFTLLSVHGSFMETHASGNTKHGP